MSAAIRPAAQPGSAASAPPSEAELRSVLSAATPPAARLVPTVLLGVLAGICIVGLLATSAWLITRAAEQPPILHLGIAIVGVRAFALGRAFFRYLERLLGHDGAFRTLGTLRTSIYRRLIPLAPDGLGGVRRGALLSGVVRDVDALQDWPLRVLQPLIISGVVVTGSVAVVAVVHPPSGLALALALLLVTAVGVPVAGRIAASSERAVSPLRAELTEALLGLANRFEVLTAFDGVAAERARIAGIDARLRAAESRVARGAGLMTALATLAAGGAALAALLLGVPALDVQGGGALDGPTLALLVLTPLAVMEVFAAVPLAVGVRRQVRASAAALAAAVPSTVPREIPVSEGGGASAAEAGASLALDIPEQPEPVRSLVLRGLVASWPGAASPTLDGIDLELAAGDRLWLRGDSGRGKTTLAHVLVRFLDHRGDYLLDGTDARSLAPEEVRRRVGLCEQTPFLFDDTVRQNLLFARPQSSEEELWAVLERVGLAEWTRRRGGLDTAVGERGALVSGGQAQRIGLARALLRDFPVLILDEPAANVDADLAEPLIAELLAAAAGAERIVILISHTAPPTGSVSLELAL